MAEMKVAPEVAQAEYERWIDSMGLEDKLDETGMEAEDRKSLNAKKQTLIKAIQRGHLVVDSEGRFVFTPRFSEDKTPLVFHRPMGRDTEAMGQAKHQEGKLFKFMVAITHEVDVRFKNLDMAYDGEVCIAIASLFLA